MSFQITLSPSRFAAARFIAKVRRALLAALNEEGRERGLTQAEIARTIDVHRSVITRELKGRADISLGRVGELAFAMGREPVLEFRKPTTADLESSWGDASVERPHTRAHFDFGDEGGFQPPAGSRTKFVDVVEG